MKESPWCFILKQVICKRQIHRKTDSLRGISWTVCFSSLPKWIICCYHRFHLFLNGLHAALSKYACILIKCLIYKQELSVNILAYSPKASCCPFRKREKISFGKHSSFFLSVNPSFVGSVSSLKDCDRSGCFCLRPWAKDQGIT